MIGTLIAVVAAGLTFFSGAQWAKSQIVARLSARFGVPVSVDGIDLGLRSQRIAGLHIGGDGQRFDVHADEVRVTASALSLATSGRQAIEAIDLVGLTGRVRADLLPKATESAKARQSGEGGVKAKALPALSIRNYELALADERGDIASLTGEQLSFRDGVIQLSAKEARLHDQGLRVSALDIKAEVQRQAGRPQLRGASVGALLGESRPDEGAFSRLPRLKAAISALRGGWDRKSEGVAQTAARADDSQAPKDEPLAAILAQDAQVTIEKAEFGTFQDGDLRPLLKRAQMTLSRSDDGRLQGAGQGVSGSGGQIRWDALVATSPLSVRADVEVDKLPLTLLSGLLPQLPWYEPEKGEISANLRLRTDSPTRVSWEGQLSVHDAALNSPRIAPVPVTGLSLTLSGKGTLLPVARRLEVEKGQVTIGDAAVSVAGHAAVKDGEYSLAVDAKLPSTDCGAAIAAIPQGLLGDLSEARFRGKIAGSLELSLDSQHLDDTVLEMDVRDRCDFLDMTAVADLRRFRMPFHHTVVEPDGTVFQMDTGPGTTAFTYLEDISPFLVHAVLAHEDTRFFTHSGFSPPHIRNAVVRNLREGRYVVGASTITMQLVKNLLLHREKTLARKVQEVILTWYLERVMDKREILELYLNVIEYGPSIYGIRQAAQHYFKRMPSELSPAEAAFFATILPSPKRYHEYYERGALPPYLVDRIRALIRRLGARGSYDDEAVAYGLSEMENFRFVPDGQLATPRTVLGSSAPLPYQSGYWSDADWDMPATNTQAFDARNYPE